MRFPSNTLHSWQCPQDGEHDLILLEGVEPDLHWQEYVAAILTCAEALSGAADLHDRRLSRPRAHTRTPRIAAVVTDAALRPELMAYDVELTDYEGPTGIQSYLLAACQERGIEGISLWGGTPTYIEGSYPHVAQAMLRLLCRMWRLAVDLQPIEEHAAELDGALHAQLDNHPDLAEYVKRLEHGLRHGSERAAERGYGRHRDEIQQFLRQSRRGPGGGGAV